MENENTVPDKDALLAEKDKQLAEMKAAIEAMGSELFDVGWDDSDRKDVQKKEECEREEAQRKAEALQKENEELKTEIWEWTRERREPPLPGSRRL